MAIPKTEREVIEMMNLETYAELFPVPFNEPNTVTRLDGKEYSEQAVRFALDALDELVLLDVIQFADKVFSYNNILGHGGAGGDMSLWEQLAWVASTDICKRIEDIKLPQTK